jgi:KRAB domain-containing zinc finger protein
MATATSEPEISINTEQTAEEEEIQKTTTAQEHKDVPREDVDTTMPPNTMSEEVAGASTTMAPSTILNVVPSESGTTKVPPMVFTETTPSESQENQDQTVVGISTTMTQNTDSNVVLSESNKTHGGEMVFTAKTATQESREDVVMTQNTISNVVLDEVNKPDGGEMVFTVVAMENNIGDLMQINPDNLPKEVQLSLVQPPPPDNSNLSSTNSGRLSDINQLAIIAASIEENPKNPGNTSSQDKQDSAEKSFKDKGRVLCTVCDQDFSDLPSMRRHRLIHSEDKPYQCDFCDKSFRRKDNLREHRNIHTQENIYKCERCGKSFPRKYTHKVHMSRFCGKPDQETSDSETWTGVNKATNAKSSMVASKTSEPCQLCFKTFRDASTLKRHLLTHSDERPYKCTECDKAFRRKDHLQEHVIVHKLVRPFSCQTCGKSFSRKNGLKTHMIRTTHLLGFDDIILPGQPKGSGDVEVHVVEQVLAADQLVATASAVFPREDSQGNDEEETVCQTTSGQDISETNLQPTDSDPRTVAVEFSQVPTNSEEGTETTVVLSEKRAEETDVANPESGRTPDETSAQDSGVVKAFLCPTCGVTFPGKEEIWKHLQEHLEENMFACRHCFEILGSAELLEEHLQSCDGGEDESAIRNDGDSQVSEGEGSVDQTADATIEEDESLGDETQPTTTPNSKKRKRVGTPERADQTCTICNKVFRDVTALRRHSLVHSGERPHACTNCEKRFRRRDHLKAHEIAHHSGITSHECKTCDAAFNTRYALTVHAKTCKNRPSSPKEISEEVCAVYVHSINVTSGVAIGKFDNSCSS